MPHQEPGPASAPPAASPDIDLKLFQHFLSALKLPGLPPPPAIASVSTEPIMEDIYAIWREEIDLHLKLCWMNVGDEASLPPYMLRLTVKHISEIIWDQITTIQVRNTEYYDSHLVPLPATILKTTKNRKYISEEIDLNLPHRP